MMDPKTFVYDIHFYMDEMLSYLRGTIEGSPLAPTVIASKAGQELPTPTCNALCAKMSKDGYMEQHEGRTYTITADGEIFSLLGGYTQQYEELNSNERRVAALEKRQARTERNMFLINLFVAIGTCGLLVLELVKIVVRGWR